MLPLMPAVNRALIVGGIIFDLIEREPLIRAPNDPKEVCHQI